MPNRILREGILSSERVNSLGCEAEIFYRRLMSVVDDYGRFSAHPSLLRAALFPLRIDIMRDEAMLAWLEQIVHAGLVRVYVVHGKRYVQMLDFRQQLRAKASKFPDPPGLADATTQHAQHMHSTCAASAHSGEGACVVEVKDEGAGGAGTPTPLAAVGADAGTPRADAAAAGAAPPAEEGNHTPGSAAPLHAQIALKLRQAGVNITGAHPLAHAWARRGLSVQHALEAVALARMRKPQGRIPPNYLAAIVEDMLAHGMGAPGMGNKTAAAPPAWWGSEAATLAKGSALGINARPGEAMADYRARLSAAIARQGQPPPAAAGA